MNAKPFPLLKRARFKTSQGIKRPFVQAFTLVELLIVVSIVSLLLAMATPYVLGAVKSTRITSKGDELLHKISLARQISQSESRPVELRFYRYAHEGVTTIYGYQLFYQEADAAKAVALDSAVNWERDGLCIKEGPLSPMVDPEKLGSGWPRKVTKGPYAERGADYVSVTIYPNGSTSLPLPLAEAYFTLVEDSAATTATSPANYYTIQVDPVTGHTRSYRP